VAIVLIVMWSVLLFCLEK